ncbi:hypothetical protein ACHAWF_004864 [Thalassiosira exigua]
MVRDAMQCWYADDMGGAATARQNALVMRALERLGPRYEYFANSGKSCLQNEWQYVSRVTQDIVHYFAPLEEAIRLKFLPALLDVPPGYIGSELRQKLSQSVQNGGIGVTNLVSTTATTFATSPKASKCLVNTLLGSGSSTLTLTTST